MKVLLVGGLYDGRYWDVPDDIRHGFRFQAYFPVEFSLLDSAKINPNTAHTLIERYEVFEYAEHGKDARVFIAAAGSLSPIGALRRMIRGYGTI